MGRGRSGTSLGNHRCSLSTWSAYASALGRRAAMSLPRRHVRWPQPSDATRVPGWGARAGPRGGRRGRAARGEAYCGGAPERRHGASEGTVAILTELKDQGTPLYALTNWSAETFPHAQSRFGFLEWFRAIVVSGDIGLIKPDADIYELLLATQGLTAAETVFIDDKGENVEAARALGFHGIRFTEPESLRTALGELGVL